jgi:transcriptional regulator with XRE-family HTH domain
MGMGGEIKKARYDKGMKAKDLAAKVGIEPKYMSQIENDKAPGMTVALFTRICDELGVSADVLLGRQNGGSKV